MCGVAGLWQKGLNKHDHKSILEDMIKELNHRGPDAQGTYYDSSGIGLAHARLSIIDLETGDQPMLSDDGSLVIVYNGEIYNYKEIKQRLKANRNIYFKTSSDTEVILKAYEVYGEKCVDYLNGMFAFAIWNTTTQSLFLARDRIGIKPLYYYSKTGVFAFASEIKALFKYSRIEKKVNQDAVIQYNVLSYQLTDKTWFKDIFLLEPGCTICVNKYGIKKQQYWQPKININYKRNYEDTVYELKGLVENAIEIHQISDVPIGAHLSGGVDSSTIVSYISNKLSGLSTFSSVFVDYGKKYNESNEIDLLVKRFQTNHFQNSIAGTDVEKIISPMLDSLDEPVAGPATIPMYFINKLVHESGIKVVNGGQGVDELFAGYPTYFIQAVRNLYLSLKSYKAVPFTELLYVPRYISNYYSGRKTSKFNHEYPIWKNANIPMDVITMYNNTADNIDSSLMPFEKSILMNLKYYLHALLQQEDRMSMAWSVESRVPFLDYRLVEYSLTIPSYYKIKKGVTKSVFRDAVRGFVPQQILENKIKRGYPTPIKFWLREGLSNLMKTTFSGELYTQDIFDRDVVNRMINDHIQCKVDHSAVLWKLLCTEMWYSNNFQ